MEIGDEVLGRSHGDQMFEDEGSRVRRRESNLRARGCGLLNDGPRAWGESALGLGHIYLSDYVKVVEPLHTGTSAVTSNQLEFRSDDITPFGVPGVIKLDAQSLPS